MTDTAQTTSAPVASDSSSIPSTETVASTQPSSEPLSTISMRINGEIVEVPIEEFERDRRKVQFHKAANETFQKASEKAKFAEDILNLVKPGNFSAQSFKTLAEKNGLSKDELMKVVEELMGEEVQDASLDPQERELRELKKWKEEKEIEDELKRSKEDERKFQMERARHQQQYLKELDSIQSKSPLNVWDPAIFPLINETFTRHNANGNRISIQDAVDIVEEKYKQYLDTPQESNIHLKTILKHRLKGKGYDERDIDALLEGSKAFRSHLIEKTKEKNSTPLTTSSPRNVSQETKSTKLSPNEFFKSQRYRGLSK